MTDNTVVPLDERLGKLADRMARVDTAAAGRMKALAAALGDTEAACTWAYADLRRAIDARSLAAQCASDTAGDLRLSAWETFRNALVFAPLILTWLGILDAANGFYRLTADNPAAAQQPFLYLWQAAFGGRSTFTLGGIALLDVGILSAVGVLTAVLMWQAGKRAARERALATEIEAELADALAEADLALAKHRLPQPYASIAKLENMAELLAELNRHQTELIGEVQAQLAALSRTIGQAAPAFSSFSQTAGDLAKGQTQLLHQLAAERGEQTRMAQAIAQAGNGFQASAQQLAQTTAHSATHSATQFATLVAELSRASQALVDAARAAQAARPSARR